MTGLIYNLDDAKEFVERILMKLEDDEVYILLLTTRKKYCPVELSKSEEMLGRELIRINDIDEILRKIKKISSIDGIYGDIRNCLALYCWLDPRSTLKGYGEFISDINKWIYDSFVGESKNLELYRRIDIKLFSAIHKNRSRGLYFVIDIDKKDESILNKITRLLIGDIEWISETHGGYHIIVMRNDETGKIIYKNIVGMENVEILKDPTTPIPGIIQGGFQVKAIRRELWKK